MVETRSGTSTDDPRIVARETDTADTHGGRRRRGSRGGGAMGTGVSDSATYIILGLALAVLALPCIFAPRLMAKAMFGRAADPPEDQHVHLLGLLSCGLLSAAVISFALELLARGYAWHTTRFTYDEGLEFFPPEEAARKHMLRTFTADTLKAALMAFAAGNLLIQLYYPATLSPLGAIAMAVGMAVTFAIPASQMLGPEDFGRVARDFRRLPRNLHYAVSLRKFSVTGALYLLLTWMLPMAGLAYFVAPKYTLYHTFGYVYGKSTQMLWKAVGGGLMTLLPAMTYTLKDKAENDLLGRTISRTLNVGLMMAAIGHLLVFGPILAQAHGGFLLPMLTASWGLALVASMAGLSAPELGSVPVLVAEVAGATGSSGAAEVPVAGKVREGELVGEGLAAEPAAVAAAAKEE